MNRNIKNSKKIILSAALLIAAASSAFAQDNGLAGINEATSMVTSYFDPGTKLIYAWRRQSSVHSSFNIRYG